jgi:methionyl aminopeptidase
MSGQSLLVPGELSPIRSVPGNIRRPEYVGKPAPTPYTGPEVQTPETIEAMRIAGRIAARAMAEAAKVISPGVTTDELDRVAHEYMCDHGAYPSDLGYRGFPKSICTSINHVVCHGIPGDKVLKDGDTVNIDVTVIKDGYHGDTSRMFQVGEVPVWAERLSQVTQECMYKAIEIVKPGCRLGDIGEVIQKHAEKNGFSVVREFCGHGIGKVFHEEPQILHYGRAGTGMELKAGMTFTIEPMINQGKADTKVLGDGWTAITKDRKLSAQWEHTLLVTDTGYEIFTLRADDTIARISA